MPSSAARSDRRPSLSARKCFSARSSCARSRSWFRGSSAVIASEAKQSILPFDSAVDCFVALLLAMTRHGANEMQKRNATAAVIGAGDYIGAEMAKKSAAEGFTLFAGRRTGAKLEHLFKEIESAGGSIVACPLDARK